MLDIGSRDIGDRSKGGKERIGGSLYVGGRIDDLEITGEWRPAGSQDRGRRRRCVPDTFHDIIFVWFCMARHGFLLHGNGQKSNRSEEHTSELQSLMRISYAVFCLKKTNIKILPMTT